MTVLIDCVTIRHKIDLSGHGDDGMGSSGKIPRVGCILNERILRDGIGFRGIHTM